MGTFYFILAFIIVLGFYAFSNSRLKKDFVIAGDSQSSRDLSRDEIKEMSVYKKHKIFKDTEGNTINPNNIIHMVVSGNSMSKSGILSGDEILVLKIDKNKPLEEQIRHGDLLCLDLEGVEGYKGYKLRVFDGFKGEKLLTSYYDEYGHKRESTRFYPKNSVSGIAKYKVGNYGHRMESTRPHPRKSISGKTKKNINRQVLRMT